MTTFIQLHFLTSYPPACLNRDDLNRPKTAVMGGVPRLRIASQSLKRAWRTSEVFKSALSGHIGIRTKLMGIEVYKELVSGKISEKEAKNWAKKIVEVFGKLKAASRDNPLNDLEIEQLAHFSNEERSLIADLTKTLIKERREPNADELNLLRKKHKDADIALWGRMLASAPLFGKEAACEVGHAITVHKVAVEDDYFTAVDDLNNREDDAGSAHIGEQGFAAGLFYLYICINRDLLIENLDGDTELANKTIQALAEVAATVAPTGKQKSFASRAWASYVLAEKGKRQPRSLSVAFLKPASSSDILAEAINQIEMTREKLDKVYYGHEKEVTLPNKTLNALTGEGSLKEMLEFIIE
jgi:CRISPR system Cascade subunit CasC